MSNTARIASVFGLVLAGGSSRRMQQDKAALLYQGQPQLQRAYDLLQPHCTQTFVSVRANQQDELRKRWPQIIDQHAEIGPLAGIAAAQAAHPNAAWLVIACDLPLLSASTIEQLLQQRDPTRLATAYRNPHDQQPEPLCAIWEPGSAALIRAAIAADEYSPRTLLKAWDTLLIAATEATVLRNVNTPDEHQQVSAVLTASHLTLNVQYFAVFREQAGKRSETISTTATTPALLYTELQQRYGFKLAATQLKAAVNNEFCDWQHHLKSGDAVAFIPPVAGG
ncbi:MAG: NTP transferase domain-containing protein [Steroidobacteraceae bacterium]